MWVLIDSIGKVYFLNFIVKKKKVRHKLYSCTILRLREFMDNLNILLIVIILVSFINICPDSIC